MRKENSNIYFTFLASVFMLIGFFAAQNVSAATPAISNVSGTVASGQTLTITGTNMVNENSANWDDNFAAHPSEYGFEDQLYSVGGSVPYHPYILSGSSWTPVLDTNVKLVGNKSVKFQANNIDNDPACGTNCGNSTMYAMPTSVWGSPDVFARWYARFNSTNWPDYYLKQFGTQPQSGAIAYTMLGSSRTDQMFFNGGSYVNYANNPPAIQNNRWHCFEVEYHNSPASYKLWFDGQLIITSTPIVPINAYYLPFGIINYYSFSASDIIEWWDNFAYGETGRIYPSSIIEISGDGGTTWKWQPPVSLSDNSLIATADLPVKTATNYLLRVTNNLQQTSPTYTLGSVTPVTYNITNFTTLVSSWLDQGSGNNSDLNSDKIVNTRDLGVMMSKWN